MVDSFIEKPDLMAASTSENVKVNDETFREHQRLRSEEASIVERDKANKDPRTGGLFRGCFNSDVGLYRAVRDEEDGVNRCPLCHWEIESGCCGQCGARFRNDGRMLLGSGFSDVASTVQSVIYSDEEDTDMDMIDADDMYAYDQRYMPENYYTAPLTLQREMAGGYIRRPASRSARPAHHWRPSSNVMADLLEEGSMATVTEEDEEEDYETDSFVVGDDVDMFDESRSRRPSNSSSQSRLSQVQGGSSISSTGSHSKQPRTPTTDEEDEDDFDEGGEISNGRSRRRLQQSLGQHGPIHLPSEDQDMEDSKALLGYEAVGSDDDDDAKTTVGTPPAFDEDRSRFGGSMTPTADRPKPPIRPPSRTGALGSRGLRRKSSTVSVSAAASYEDGEADDDDSGGELCTLADNEARNKPSASKGISYGIFSNSLQNAEAPRRGPSTNLGNDKNGLEVEADSFSDSSAHSSSRRGIQKARAPEYDPKISLLFAQHQNNLRSAHSQGSGQSHHLIDSGNRSRTPVQRPRTSNRNRAAMNATGSSTIPFSSPFSNIDNTTQPISVGSSPSASNSTNQLPNIRANGIPHSASRASSEPIDSAVYARNALSSAAAQRRESAINFTEDPWSVRDSSANPASTVQIDGPASPTLVGSSLGPRPPAITNGVERPRSRAAHNYGNSGSPFSPPYIHSTLTQSAPGLGIARNMSGNPFFLHMNSQSASNRSIRRAPSNTALRHRGSRSQLHSPPQQAPLRDLPQTIPQYSNSTQNVHPNLRHVPSQQRIRSQNSSRSLRGATAPPSSSPRVLGEGVGIASPRQRPAPLTADEKARRVGEVIASRREFIARREVAPQQISTQNHNNQRGQTPGDRVNGQARAVTTSQHGQQGSAAGRQPPETSHNPPSPFTGQPNSPTSSNRTAQPLASGRTVSRRNSRRNMSSGSGDLEWAYGYSSPNRR